MSRLPSELEINAALAHRRRLQAVRLTGMLDSPKDERFDRLTRLAAKLIGVPATFISFIDEDRDFYKSSYWAHPPQHDVREVEGRTFCHYGLVSAGPLVVDNVVDHPEFQAIPLIDVLGVRAYLGVPLITDDGMHLGSFCAIDMRARHWTEGDIEILSELAHSTLREIKLQHALQDVARNLEAAKEAVRKHEELVATIAHDLLGPLQIVTFSAESLLLGDLTPAQRTSLTRVSVAGDGMAERLKSLTGTASRSLSGLVLKDVSVEELLSRATSMMAAIADRKQVRLEFEVEPGLPHIRVDLARLLRILGALIGNAVKFGPANATVRITAERHYDMICVSVIDHGMGIPEDQLPHVFDRLLQPELDQGQAPGVGLGLAIAKELVEAHGGTISATSTHGKGSTFSFTLPTDSDDQG